MPRDLKPCGTRAAYQRHKRRGEEPCEACAEALRAHYRVDVPKPRTVKPCGTRAAYQRHVEAGETPCEPCREANRAEVRARRRRAGVKPRPVKPCGTYAAYQRHMSRKETPCGPCQEAARENSRVAMERRRARLAPPPLEVPRVVQGPDVGPCAVPANGFLWDPRGDDESAAEARERHRVAAVICRTQCPVFAWCHANAPRVGGVVAGVRS